MSKDLKKPRTIFILFIVAGSLFVAPLFTSTCEKNITYNKTVEVSRCDIYANGVINCYKTTDIIEKTKTINETCYKPIGIKAIAENKK